MVFKFWVGGIERIDPAGEFRQNSIPAPIGEFTFGMVSCVLFGSLEMIEQLGDRSAENNRGFVQRTILCSDTPDAALSLVASRVIKIHLAVTLNSIVKV